MAENDKFVAPVDVKEQLQKTAKIYRNKLITMPTRGLKKSLSYMTLRPGIRVSETVGELTGGAEFGPYDENRVADGNVKITPRTLEVFFGNVDIKFSPNSVYSTIWGANVTNGDALKNVPITLQVLQLLALKLGKTSTRFCSRLYATLQEQVLLTSSMVSIPLPRPNWMPASFPVASETLSRLQIFWATTRPSTTTTP